MAASQKPQDGSDSEPLADDENAERGPAGALSAEGMPATVSGGAGSDAEEEKRSRDKDDPKHRLGLRRHHQGGIRFNVSAEVILAAVPPLPAAECEAMDVDRPARTTATGAGPLGPIGPDGPASASAELGSAPPPAGTLGRASAEGVGKKAKRSVRFADD